MALEKIRSSAGHSLPIGGVSGSESKPFDGMDPVSSALLMVSKNVTYSASHITDSVALSRPVLWSLCTVCFWQ